MFLVEKRNGDIKARGCDDGIKQHRREDDNTEYSTSPNVSTEGVMITFEIEDHAEGYVACFEIPDAYLHTLTDEQVIMLLSYPLEELMVMVDT